MMTTENTRLRDMRDTGVIKSVAAEPSARGLYPGPSARLSAAPRSAWAYRKAALTYPSNLIALCAILMFSLVIPSGQIVLWGLGAELLFLCLAPRSAWLRRCLDEGLLEAAEAARVRAREALVAKMSEGHRDEWKRLDGLIKKIHEEERREARVTPVCPIDLHRLSGSYIRLALAHKACEEALALTEQRSLRASIRALEAASPSATERVRAAIRERLRAAQERVADEARVREDLEVITHQLALIADIIYLRHQREATCGPATEAERFVQDLDETRSAAREIADLDAGASLAIEPVACA